MKYKELLDALKGMNEKQLNAEVMVFGMDDDTDVCRLVTDDLHLNTEPMGAIMVDGEVTDDYYGIGDDADSMVNVKKLLDCHQPYLMIGSGSIPTCKES